MASNPIALYDACVLYSAPLRDLLMQLALTDLFQARWTDEIHDEWIRNVLKNRPDLTIEQLTRRFFRTNPVAGHPLHTPTKETGFSADSRLRSSIFVKNPVSEPPLWVPYINFYYKNSDFA